MFREEERKHTPSNYPNQVILNLDSSISARKEALQLKIKWMKNNYKSCLSFDAFGKINSQEIIQDLSLVEGGWRVYLLAEGLDKIKGLGDSKGDFLSNEKIAKFFAINLTHKSVKLNAGCLPVYINVVACDFGKSGFESGAADLQRKLFALGLNTWVIARNTTVGIGYDELTEQVFKLTDTIFKQQIHKQPGSKVIFRMDENSSLVMEDAYAYSWKKQALSTLKTCSENTTEIEKGKKLTTLLSQLSNQTPPNLLKTLQENFKAHSFIDNPYLSISLWKTNTRKRMDETIAQGDRVIASKCFIPTIIGKPG